MELVFSRKDMAKAMQMAGGAVGKAAILPVLSNVLISAERDPLWYMLGHEGDGKGSIYVAATDLEIGIRTRIPGHATESGAITIPAKEFASVIKALPQEDVKLIASQDRARIRCEKGEFKMVGISASQFPSLMGEASQDAQLELTERPEDKKETRFFSLDSDVLGRMIRKTSFAASRDDARYFLNGVHLSLKSEQDGTLARMAATDGTRLAVASATIEESLEDEVGVIIPNRTVRELEKLTATSDAVKIGMEGNRIIFHTGDTALVSAQLEGEYPDYQQVIPAQSKINLKVVTKRLLSAARRMMQVADPKLWCIRLEVKGNRLKVSASSAYLGDGCEEMDVGSAPAYAGGTRKEKDGDDMTIAVNVRYLMDALKAIDSQETLIGIDEEAKPVVIKPFLHSVRGQASGHHLCVLMPIRL